MGDFSNPTSLNNWNILIMLQMEHGFDILLG